MANAVHGGSGGGGYMIQEVPLKKLPARGRIIFCYKQIKKHARAGELG
jgi:hypothetical protein